MLRHRSVLVLLAVLLATPGCSWVPKWGGGWFGLVKTKPAAPEATLPTWVGRVVMVDAENRFALVDTGAPLKLPPGHKLLAFRDQRRTALLETTGEIRPPFLAVQMLEGMPALNDQVAMDESYPPGAIPAN